MVELSELSDGRDISELLLDFHHAVGDVLLVARFPAARDGFLQRDSPLATYAFVQIDAPDSKILKLERSPYVSSVICIQGSIGRYRKVQKVTTSEIAQMVERDVFKEEYQEGDKVLVDAGTWAGLYGIVVELLGARLKVYIELHSRKRIVTLPREDVTLVKRD